MAKTKYVVTALTVISALGITFTANYEGYKSKPYKDSAQVWSIGEGTTVYPNGQRVKATDSSISRKQARKYLTSHMTKDAQRFNKTLQGVKLSQAEYDLYMDFTYQFGIGAWSKSSMLRNLKAENYVQACDSLLKWKFVGKKDCYVRSNNCWGVWKRQLDRHRKCRGAQ